MEAAVAAFEMLGNYEDTTRKLSEINTELSYQMAVTLMKTERYEEAVAAFKTHIGYKDSAALSTECTYLQAKAQMAERNYEAAIDLLMRISSNYQNNLLADKAYKDSNALMVECVQHSLEKAEKNGIVRYLDVATEGDVKVKSAAMQPLSDGLVRFIVELKGNKVGDSVSFLNSTGSLFEFVDRSGTTKDYKVYFYEVEQEHLSKIQSIVMALFYRNENHGYIYLNGPFV